MSKKLVLFVEGESDGPAIANLVNRILNDLPTELQGLLFTDGAQAHKVGNVPKLSGSAKCQQQWLRRLQRVQTKRDLGGVLTVLDGDEDYFEGRVFCSSDVARTLVERGKATGAGATYSLAVVILRQEFESLLIAGSQQIGLKPRVVIPPDPEAAPRGAKKWLRDNLSGGYQESSDQLTLTRAIKDWTPLRSLRCFRRLESAVRQLAQAIADGKPIATPADPTP